MKKKLMLLTLLPFSTFSIAPIACTKETKFNDFNALHDNYVSWFNQPNVITDFSYAYPNSYNEQLKNINLLTGSKIIRIASQKQPVIDFRDNITIQPTELWYKMEFAREIIISSVDDNGFKKDYSFTTDEIERVDLNDTLEENKNPHIYYPEKDKGNGFNKPFIFVPSSNENSINHPLFREKLKKAKSVTIKFKNSEWNNEVYWTTGGVKTKYLVTAKDFKFGLIKTALQNKEYRNVFLKNMNLSKQYENVNYDANNPYFNGVDLVQFFKNYQIKYNNLLNPDLINSGDINSIHFTAEDNVGLIDFSNFLEQLLIYSNFIDAIPYEYLKEKYETFNLFSDNNFYKWFYNYGKTFSDRLYASYYYISKHNDKETILWRNKHYNTITGNWNNTKHLNEIKFKYNSIPINNDTFNLQMINAFKQNIISELNISSLSTAQKNDIIDQYNKFNLNYYQDYQKYQAHNKIILNNLITPESNYYFNQTFSQLYYGLTLNDLINNNYNVNDLFKPETLEFRSLLNNVINPYALSKINNQDIWLSQAPLDIKIIANNTNNTNYQYLKDAHLNIHKQIILKQEQDIIKQNNNTTSYDNYLKYNELNNILNLKERFKSIDFEYIKNRINEIIAKNNITDTIEWEIPIIALNSTNEQIALMKNIIDIFKDINILLKPSIKFITDFNEYNEYFKSSKSIYKEADFVLNNSITNDFIVHALSNNNYQVIMQILSNINSLAYPNLNKLVKMLINEKIFETKLINLNVVELLTHLETKNIKNEFSRKINKYLFTLNTSEVINLINEINNINSYNISFSNGASINKFNKIAYQKYIYKPYVYDGLNYLQDIILIGD
ncbi:Uncharacterised protein [Metamycoplasma cloacale]|uniref:Uncharacterized protein n=1 Tax=Metamycoplasma cloacale TaxID=92401 RepID=A0A2Z4LLP2_9BACT|nr:hypothetical protein [Metamycoplasma cloacale]AWX42594.1 hypothetical protein DK849_00645 [Metamycoplasma cloacale]VEU79676.1 Uncharacterised protein [Metamycoplasma cloacale]